MAEIDTSREAVERLAEHHDERVRMYEALADGPCGHLRLKQGAETAQFHRDTAVTLRALQAERDAAWNDAIEAAAELCNEYQDWCKGWGESKNAVASETAATKCRDAIRALRKGGDDGRQESGSGVPLEMQRVRACLRER